MFPRALIAGGRSWILWLLPATLLVHDGATAHASEVVLQEGRSAALRLSLIPDLRRARFRFRKDAALAPHVRPLRCPEIRPSLRIRTSGGFDTKTIPLPCEFWRSLPSGYRYDDRRASNGGVRRLVYAQGTFSVTMKGGTLNLPAGPLPAEEFLELRFSTGGETYCGRFEDFARNSDRRVVARSGSTACEPLPAPPGPHIVVIVGDDIDWRRLAFLGEDPRMLTPELDRLAADGVTFPAGHLSTSLCRPMHRHLLTGVPPGSKVPRTWGTLPEEMRAAGRRTFSGGKLWDQSAALWGFDGDAGDQCSSAGFRCGNPDFGRAAWDVATCGLLGDPDVPCPATGAWRDFLATVAENDRIFALFTPLLPHNPFAAPPEYHDLYTGQETTPAEAQYLPMMTWFDGFVGEVLRDLESAGLREETLVVYFADNGYRSDSGVIQVFDPSLWRGKGSLHEMGFRTPVVFSWPGAMATVRGTWMPGVVGLEDVFASLLALAGRPVPNDVQGHDLAGSILDGLPSPRSHLVAKLEHTRAEGWIVRTEDWRYIHDLGEGVEHLYAIGDDPDEDADLIGVATPEELAVFHQRIDEWRARNE